jgi:hypothetical protein
MVSVLELRSKLRDGGIDAGYVADRLRAEVLASRIDARVMSRENMLVLLQAQGKQLADCEGECEVETGRRVGADLVVSGELLRVGETLKASLRLHETRSGTLLGAATAAGLTAEELDSRLGPAVQQLVASLRRPPAGAAARSPRPATQAFDAKAFAAAQPSAFDCESAARGLRESAADQGWSALVACVERGWSRGDFTHLERITAGFWDRDLTTRSDAPRLIAKIIALRGGDVEGDLSLVQKSRVPLFTLAAALRQPDVYRGRWVLMRGALSEIRQDSGRPAALVRETSLRATSREVQVGTMTRIDRSKTTNARAEVETTRYGNARGSAHASSSSKTDFSTLKQRFDNERVETGRHAVGKLAQADPFLEPEKDFLFLARFDGVNSGQDQQPVAMLSIAGYFQPNALLIQ